MREGGVVCLRDVIICVSSGVVGVVSVDLFVRGGLFEGWCVLREGSV